jgi:hypothetical protein
MASKYSIYLKFFTIIFIFTSYLIGFFLRENIAGGAEKDFLYWTYPAILAFKENFYQSLLNYRKIGEGSLPLFHMINAYLNPFSHSPIFFQASITVISLLNVLFFSQILNKKYKIRKIDSFFYSSLFLILPFFRSSSYWGLTENIGCLFLILAIKYYNIYELNRLKQSKKILTVFYLCLFSSLALYIRPYLIFFPVFIMLKSILLKDSFLFKFSSIYYFILSLPGFYLIYLWDGSFNIGPNQVDLLANYHNPKFILKNIIIFASIILFYLIPFEISKMINKLEFPKKQNIIIFFFSFIILLVLNHFNKLNYLIANDIGGGVFLKINNLLSNNLFLFILISSIGVSFIYDYIKVSKQNLILFFCLLIYCFPKFIFQEYFEPLVIILLFTILTLKRKDLKIFKQNKTMIIFLIYFLCYYLGSFYYRYII